MRSDVGIRYSYPLDVREKIAEEANGAQHYVWVLFENGTDRFYVDCMGVTREDAYRVASAAISAHGRDGYEATDLEAT